MATIRKKKAPAPALAESRRGHFASVESAKLAGIFLDKFPSTPRSGRPDAAGAKAARTGTGLRGLLAEAATLANSGEVGRLSAEQFVEQWSVAFTFEELTAIVIPERTLARRKKAGEPLTVDETERALRLARIATEAERVFADPAKAARWLRKPNRVLNLQTPLTLLETETGARAVEEALGQIDHGVYA